jgi:hypothetical protein
VKPVQQLLAPGRHSEEEKTRARQALKLGPWAWPTEGRGLARARHLAGEPPTEAAAGRAIVLTVGDSQRSAWMLSTDGSRAHADHAALAQSAKRAVERAHRLLAERTRLAWRPLPAVSEVLLTRLDTVYTTGSVQRRLPVEGDSLGLSTVLALASTLYGQPVPADIVASAAVDAQGALGEVGRITDKVRTIRDCLPRVRRVVVAAGQVEAWKGAVLECAAGSLEIVGFKTAWAAVEALLDPVTSLEQTEEAHQPDVLHALANTLKEGRSAVLTWRPVARAVRHMRQCWRLSEDQRAEADLVLLVAQRYAGEVTPADVDIDTVIGWVGRRHIMARLPLLAHLVQHHATYGLDMPPALASLVEPMLDADVHPFAYKVRGAWARWLAADGQAAAALTIQRRIVEDLVQGMEETEASYGLAEWMRLAGALGDSAAFDAALALEARLDRQGALHDNSRMYLDWAAASGGGALGRVELARDRRRRVLAAAHVPNHRNVSSRTLRALRAALDESGEPPELTPTDDALDRLRQGRISVDDAIERLGIHGAVARRLVARGGVDMLLRLFPA